MSSKQEPMSTSVPRKVAVTSSKMSSKTKTRTSSKCSLITEAFGKSTWSRKSDNYENAKSVISSYATHMKSSCKCVPDVGLQYLTGNAYFELFLSKLKRVQKKVAEIEAEHIDEDHLKPSSPCDEDIRENPSLDHVSESHKPSKLDSLALQNIVNLNTHRKLLVSLSEALKFWTHAAYSSSYRDYDLAKLRVSEYLTTACYVFRCYRLNDCLESCSLMLVKLGEPTDCMTGYCLLTNLYMDLGRIQEATNAMSKAAQLEKELMLQCMESYELYLFKLTKCEYDLVTGTSVKDAGRRLHEIIHSPYLQKLTLNRYYLKGIALLLATKFHFEDYSYSTDHQEFIEPIQVSICLVKRWHRNLFDPVSGTKGNEGVGDPEWLKFASYSMLLKAYEVISVFSRGCGQPVELLFYHNPLIRLCRQNCFIYWVQRLLLIGSEVDEMTDKLRCRAMKLHNALEVTAKQSRLDIAVKKRSKPISKSQVDEVDVEDDFRLSSIETERGGMVSCLHEANFIPWQVKRQAMNVKDSDDDDVFGNDYSLPIFKSSSEGIAGLEISHMSISLQMLTSKDTDFLQRLTESKSPFADFGNAVGINVSLVNQVSSEWFEAKAKFVLVLLRHLIEKGQYKSSLSFIKTLFSKNYSYIENYSNRVLLVTVISRYLEVSLKISSEKIKSVVYNACEIEDAAIFGGSRKNSLNSSPAVSSMKLQSKIQAPKKQPYKMDLLQEYYAAQSEELLKVIKGVPSPLSKLLPTKKSLKSSRTAKSIDFVNEAGGDSPKITRQSRRIKSNIENFTYHSGRAELSRNKSSSDFIEPLPFSDFRIKPNPVEKLISEFEQLEMSGTSENAAIRAMKALDGSSSNKLRDSLSYLLHNYLGNHPPANLYTKLCSLLSDVYNLKENFSKRLSGYYFAESATCASLRYRCIRISEKKQRRKMKMKLPVKDLMYRDFKCKATRLEELLAPLPENWRVTQISAINFKGKRQIPDLKLVRYERGKKPLSLTIIGSSDKFVIDFMDELTEIIQLSNGSIINKDATTFWKVRYALDDRLKVLLNGVELSWFGPFKGFFLGKVEDPVYYEMVSAAQNRVLKESSSRKLVCSDPDLLN
ncbi:hypothetical protein HDE_09003 [Halotydeus destructor]|nr:hypothetical protein HDE_09003 [Halotydeus destructor]